MWLFCSENFFTVLLLLFELIAALPAILGMLLFVLAFGLPIYLAFEVNAWLILTMPFTLGSVAWLMMKYDDYAYQVRKEMRKQGSRTGRNHVEGK